MSNLLKSTFIVMALAGISKVLGLLRETTMASAYGVSEVMDAFLVAVLMPQFISSMMQSGVIKAFVSMYHEAEGKRGERAAASFTKTLLIFTLCFGFILYLIFDNTSTQVLHMIAPGFTAEKLELATKLLAVMMPGFILMVSTDILGAYLQAKGQFTYATSGPIVFNIVTVLLVGIFAVSVGIFAAAYAYLLSAVLQFFILLFGSFRIGLWKELKFSIEVAETKNFALLILPILAAIAFSQTNTVIDRIFASGLSEGSISALNYSYKVHWLVIALFVIPFSTAFFPALSELYNRERAVFNEKVQKLAKLLIFVALPINVFAIILAQPIISLIFQRGAFQMAAVATTAEVFICYLLGLVFQVLVLLLLDVAYVMQKTRLAFIVAASMTVCNVTMNYYIVNSLAAPGLAISTSVAQLMGCIILYCIMVKKYKVFQANFLVNELSKIATLCIVPGVLVICWRYLTAIYGIKPFPCIAIGAALFGGSYLICALIGKRPEITDIIDLLKKQPIVYKVKSLFRIGGAI